MEGPIINISPDFKFQTRENYALPPNSLWFQDEKSVDGTSFTGKRTSVEFNSFPKEDAVALVGLLKACGSQRDLHKGSKIHDHVQNLGLLQTNIHVGNAVISMYAKCGALVKAQNVFHQLPARNIVSWNALIIGYAQHGQNGKAFHCFNHMQQQGLSPNAVTFAYILKACYGVEGEKIHAEIVRHGLLQVHTFVGNAVVDMYAKCGKLKKAHQVFVELPSWDVISWNTLIAGYTQNGYAKEALMCFEQMKDEGFIPNAITFTSVLTSCGIVGAVAKGEEIGTEIARQGLLKEDTILGSALVDMYAKCGALTKAQKVFNEIAVRDVVAWSALIGGYAQHGYGHEALNCFRQMRSEGFLPNAITFTCILKACGAMGAVDQGEEIHAEVRRQGLLKHNVIIGNTLIDMYGKCGELTKAKQVFDELPVRCIVSWSALIAGYTHHGYGIEALNCYEQMQHAGLSPDAVTFICILKACASIGAAGKGEEVHSEVVRQGLMKNNAFLLTALIDMNCKCGALARARKLFDELPIQDIVSWNALIAGYAQFGKAVSVIKSFNRLRGEGIEPDEITFVTLVNVCGHSGLAEEGQLYFETMSTVYDIMATIEHYTCMVDLFGRAQLFEVAVGVIKRMSSADISDYIPLWSAILGACRKWENVEFGRLAFGCVMQLDGKDAPAYVCMRNLCSFHNLVCSR